MDAVLSEILASPIVGMAGAAIGITAAALWLAAAWWSYVDASRRSKSGFAPLAAAGWIVLGTPLLLPLSLAIYRVARPQVTSAETHEQELALEFNHAAAFKSSECVYCNARIDPGWLRCPACATWLALPCGHCGRTSPSNLEVCPFCADESARISPSGPIGHEKAAASEVPAAAVSSTRQRGIASSLRPASYAASRESSSASL